MHKDEVVYGIRHLVVDKTALFEVWQVEMNPVLERHPSLVVQVCIHNRIVVHSAQRVIDVRG